MSDFNVVVIESLMCCSLSLQEADFTAASLSLLAERAEVVDFGEWFGIHNTRFLTRVSRLLDGNFLLFQIFKWQVITIFVRNSMV